MSLPASFRCASGALLASALAVGPLNFASTRAGGMWLLNGLLGVAAVAWSAGLLVERRIPFTPTPVLLGLAALVFVALLWLSGGIQPTTAADFTRTHLARVVARWPQSVVGSETGTVIAFHAGLALALWMIADLARDGTWLLTFASVIVGTAVLVALLAFTQNQTHATGIFWQGEGRMPGQFWGTFFHHTSAGAYLNTAWPLAAGLLLSLRHATTTGPVGRRCGVLAGIALVVLLGAHTTHISRFPQLAALLVLPLLILALRRAHSSWGGRSLRWPAIAGLGMIAIALGAGRLGEISQRWNMMNFSTMKTARPIPAESDWPKLVRADLLIPNLYNAGMFGDRGEALRTAWRAIVQRPLTGHGPGNWAAASSRNTSDPYVRSFYLYLQFAHDDFLQTWVEWGIAGFSAMLLLLPGAVISTCRRISSAGSFPSVIGLCAATGLLAVLLQSLLDFPLQIPAIALNVTALAGLCWAATSTGAANPAAPSPIL